MSSSGPFRDSLRSQSSVQLMGFIDHCVRVDVQETTEEGELRIRGYETLLGTSTAVLSCIQVLRRIIREYAYGRVGRELQHLSLTVASFERVLYTFIKEEIVVASKHYASRPPVDFRTKTALKDIIPLIPTDERYTILSGGVASLLRHATKSLEETRQVLEELQSGYNPDRENRWSRTSVVLVLTFMFLYKRFRIRTSFKQFVMQVLPTRQMIKWGLVLLVAADYWNRAMYRFSNLRRIKVHHARVLMALRLFLLCQHVLQRARPISNASDHRLLIDNPMEADIDDDLKNATTLLVERVPLPAEYYDRSSEPAFAHSILGLQNKLLLKIFGPPLLLMAIPYYAIRNAKAARYTTRTLIDHPNVDVIRMGWQVFGESRLVRLITSLQCPKIPMFEEQFMAADGSSLNKKRKNESDIGIYLFSARPMESVKAGTWTNACTPLTTRMIACGLPSTRPVLLYIHGGGFFGRFIAKDFYNLTNWACVLGAVIVYVGFRPGKIALFGESAGANMGAALCIRCIQDGVELPSGNVFMFPALNLHLSPSPSRFIHQNDPVLPRSILELALTLYYPSHGHSNQYKLNIHDPCVSPGLAEDSLLEKFPPTSLVVGDLDPLLDDSVDFYTRLSFLKVPSTLKIYSGLSHGFLIYGDLVPEAQKAIDETCERVQNYIRLR
ncbi:Alpha/Beta hydrolase fold [Phytophthora cactorum]|nr:Alpha/Beta hydrolase fold [Phytophthora cactorum]